MRSPLGVQGHSKSETTPSMFPETAQGEAGEDDTPESLKASCLGSDRVSDLSSFLAFPPPWARVPPQSLCRIKLLPAGLTDFKTQL